MVLDVAVQLAPIRRDDLTEVGDYLHRRLNHRLSPAAWASAIVPTWPVESPNHGFLLRADGAVVGVQLAIYSTREIDGVVERFCNLAAWCVDEPYRGHGLRMLRAVLAQPDYHFTDLSPSGNVVPLNRRLRFESLETDTALALNLPLPWSRRVAVVTDETEIERLLDGADQRIFADHRGAAAVGHVVISTGSEHCYVVFRRDRRKHLRLFASLLHVGNPELLARHRAALGRHLLRQGLPFTLGELRVTRSRPRGSIMLASPRPKMFRSSRLAGDAIDNLYSELTLVAW
jgi:hypothetical protein